MLNLQNITHDYGKKRALNGVTLSVEAPNLIALIGPNGGGKSTLLKIIAGVIPLQKGTLDISIPRNKIAYIPQQNSLDHNFPIRVHDVVAMGLYQKTGPLGRLTDADHMAVKNAIDAVGLEGMENALISTLSGGQFQRMMFARTIVQDADLLLLDEPFAAIDVETKHKLLALITQWHKNGKTVIVVLHDIRVVADYFPHIVMLSHIILKAGTPTDVFGEDLLQSTLFQNTEQGLDVCF